MSYADFLERKRAGQRPAGRDIAPGDVHPMLHPWQVEITAWACRTGRAAIWADTGLGKTLMQIEWARFMALGRPALIVAPLAVCQQTVREAAKVGVDARYVRDGGQITGSGLWITNYEMVPRFNPERLGAVVLDEASILKQHDGATRRMLVEHFAGVPHRLACTATPAPNEPEELTSQAEFLGVMRRADMLAAYFVHDDQGWRLKGHASGPMFRWMASWALAIRRPSDIGHPDDDYLLPPLTVTGQTVPVDTVPDDQLFATDLGGVGGRAAVRRETLEARCQRASEIVAAEPGEPWILWCGLNAEAERLAALIPGAINVHGTWTPEDKAAALLDFADGRIRYLITKPSIAAFGLNWQHCARVLFVGLGDSYEQYYQAIRRCWRYGQTRPVDVHVVLSELESQIAANVAGKERQAAAMTARLVDAMRLGRAAA